MKYFGEISSDNDLVTKKYVEDLIANVIPQVMFERERHHIVTAGDITINGGNFVENTYTVTKSGYFPLGIVGHTFSGTNRTWMTEGCKSRLVNAANGTCDIDIVMRNLGTNAWSGGVYVDILWVKV